MRKLILLLLATYAIMANPLPQSIHTTVKAIRGNSVELATTVPKGLSGIVLHNYGNGLVAITHSVVSKGDGRAELLPYKSILHPNIPTVKTKVNENDRVIFGSFYDNVLLIAPTAKSYSEISKKFKKTWIHPDAYALAFMKEEKSAISLDSLQRFARANQIGLVLLTSKNYLLILDPISKQFIGQEPLEISVQNPMKPFFSRFEQMNISDFGWSDIKLKDYYKAIEELK
jgi:hypothetical protein